MNSTQEKSEGNRLDLSFHVTNSEICLLEDPTKSRSRAFVNNSSFLFRYSADDQQKKMSMIAKSFELYKCLMHKQFDTAISIVAPFDFSLNGFNSDVTDICIENIHITFSYRVSFLLCIQLT